ncbi:MAG: hypothetical protein Q8P41_11960 [Pseudomonadota bacterium]|nr:hypothetical protein [Pseudomonadota bacterium]
MRDRLAIAPNNVAVYERALRALSERGDPFLVGGAWGMAELAGVWRHTKDLDLFVLPESVDQVLGTLTDAGFRTEVLSPVWLGKAWYDELFIDIIFSSGNGIATVDDLWFQYSTAGTVLEVPVQFCPAEETIWSKAWIMERERYDGADVAHLIRAAGPRLDWRRLLDRFGPHWRVLFGHLVLFGYVYPSERSRVPAWVMLELSQRLQEELGAAPPREKHCLGPLLSKQQYLCDIDRWGYTVPADLAEILNAPRRGR